jgi:glycosyltransferase involved in cell wall biosynthesis
MLTLALRSVVNQIVPDNGALSIIVVENDRRPRARDIVDNLQATTSVPIKYCLETRIGIPYARNRSLEEALVENADWIAILDDDETAPPDWLVLLYGACQYFGADVATGSARQIPEVPPPHWWKPLSQLGKPTGFMRGDAYTNNVMFNAKLIAADGFALRFDDRLTFGADDIDFFRRAHAQGARIVTVAEAVVNERVPASRLSLSRVLRRTYMVAAANAHLGVLRDGRAKAGLRRLPSIVRRSLIGLLLLMAGTAVWPVKKLTGEKFMFKGGSSLTKAWGSLCGLAGGTSNYYGNVDGT